MRYLTLLIVLLLISCTDNPVKNETDHKSYKNGVWEITPLNNDMVRVSIYDSFIFDELHTGFFYSLTINDKEYKTSEDVDRGIYVFDDKIRWSIHLPCSHGFTDSIQLKIWTNEGLLRDTVKNVNGMPDAINELCYF